MGRPSTRAAHGSVSPVTPPYPCAAVVGLADLRPALLRNAVSPAIGGVLIRGEKGTAKSTIVRALAGLLPHVDVLTDCRFSCDPARPDPPCPPPPPPPRPRRAGAGARPPRGGRAWGSSPSAPARTAWSARSTSNAC